MSESVVYLSGPHGAGKTSTIRYLESHYGYVIGARTAIATPEASAYERASIRAVKYLIEQRQNRTREPGTNGVLLGDRCIYDTLAYLDAYAGMNWITNTQHLEIKKHISNLFAEEGHPDKVVILLPSIEVLRNQLDLRSEEDRRWRQGDLDFLRLLRSAYADLQKNLTRSCKTLLIEAGDYAEKSARIHTFAQESVHGVVCSAPGREN